MFLPRCAASIALFVIPLLAASAPATAEPTVWYVDASASGNQTGTSWTNAFVDLQDALAAATAGDEIWVARGEYRPAGVGGDRTASFQLKNGVGVYGGFVGNEVARSERDPLLHETVLSGDLNGDDFPANPTSDCCVPHAGPGCDDPVCEAAVCQPTAETCCDDNWLIECAAVAGINCDVCASASSAGDNAQNVVKGGGTNATAVLDGFTVRGGHYDNSLHPVLGGGGMLNYMGSPTVLNCRFVANFSNNRGGGMLNFLQSHPYVENCTFVGNYGLGIIGGAGMANDSGSHPTVVNCHFLANGAAGAIVFGGGMHNSYDSSPLVVGCLFSGCRGTFGGAMVNDTFSSAQVVNCKFMGAHADALGGAVVSTNSSFPVFSNCVFSGNDAGEDGGAVCDIVDAFSTLINCSFSGNGRVGGVVATRGLTPTIINSVFYGNVGGLSDFTDDMNISYSAIETQPLCCAWNGSGNVTLGESPFVDPDGADNVVGTPDDDLRLKPDAPCIDAGSNFELPQDVADLDADGDVTETLPEDLAGALRPLDDPGTPDTGAGFGPPIVDMGAYEFFADCNRNGVPDHIDIESGNSPDVNGNGKPDECEPNVIPTASTWGLAAMTVGLLWMARRRFGQAPSPAAM